MLRLPLQIRMPTACTTCVSEMAGGSRWVAYPSEDVHGQLAKLVRACILSDDLSLQVARLQDLSMDACVHLLRILRDEELVYLWW